MPDNSVSSNAGEIGVVTDFSLSATPCVVTAITLRSGTTASSLVLKDGATVKWGISLIATTAAGDQTHSVSFPRGLKFSTSCIVTQVGTGSKGYVAIGA